MKDRHVIDKYIDHLRGTNFPNLELSFRPDELNRCSKDIDAIAGHLAIEHTSIGSFENQRRNEAWYREIFGPLESKFRKELEFRLTITIENDCIERVESRPRVRKALEEWIGNGSILLSPGEHQNFNIPQVPFPVLVRKKTSSNTGLFFFVSAVGVGDLSERLINRTSSKIKKLKKYEGQYRTILLIENSDGSLMNYEIFEEAILKAFDEGPPEGVSEVWYADSSFEPECRFYKMLGGET